MPPTSETIVERLIRMEEKLDHYLHLSNNQAVKMESFDVRIRAVEAGTSKLLGYVGVVAISVSAFGSFIIQRLMGH